MFVQAEPVQCYIKAGGNVMRRLLDGEVCQEYFRVIPLPMVCCPRGRPTPAPPLLLTGRGPALSSLCAGRDPLKQMLGRCILARSGLDQHLAAIRQPRRSSPSAAERCHGAAGTRLPPGVAGTLAGGVQVVSAQRSQRDSAFFRGGRDSQVLTCSMLLCFLFPAFLSCCVVAALLTCLHPVRQRSTPALRTSAGGF